MNAIGMIMQEKGVTLEALTAELSNMGETQGTPDRVKRVVNGGSPYRTEAQRIAGFLGVKPTALWNDYDNFKDPSGI